MVPRRLARLAEVAAARADEPEHRTPALQTLAWAATSPEHFELLDDAAADDVDLAWRVQVRRASLGRYDEAAVEDLLARDPDPDAQVRALGGRRGPADRGGQGRGLGAGAGASAPSRPASR